MLLSNREANYVSNCKYQLVITRGQYGEYPAHPVKCITPNARYWCKAPLVLIMVFSVMLFEYLDQDEI